MRKGGNGHRCRDEAQEEPRLGVRESTPTRLGRADGHCGGDPADQAETGRHDGQVLGQYSDVPHTGNGGQGALQERQSQRGPDSKCEERPQQRVLAGVPRYTFSAPNCSENDNAPQRDDRQQCQVVVGGQG
ncbi:hypothetical protein GCM10010524_11380 [Streptomyces mexicanus]